MTSRNIIGTAPRERSYGRLDQSLFHQGRHYAAVPHQLRSGLSPAEIRAFIDGYEAGRTANELGEEVGVSRQTIVRHLKKNGITTRRRPITEDEPDRAIGLYKQGWSLAKIGELLNRDPTTISHMLEQAGVQRPDTQGRDR
jgi:IS30 family transposase